MTNQQNQQSEQQKKKRFYKAGQIIWAVELKKEVIVKSVNKGDLTITVEEKLKDGIVEHTFPLWAVDVLKYKAKEELVVSKLAPQVKLPKIFFAKVRDSAIIPSKREEYAGYDIYANVNPTNIYERVIHEIYVPAFTTTMIPTGIAIALPSTHYFNVKHERGSTAKPSMSVLAGVVDSGYRGEIFVALTPLHKDILITSEVTEIEVQDNLILYPYSKAIAQATIDLVPEVEIEVISFEDLQEIESERGTTKLGQSGK